MYSGGINMDVLLRESSLSDYEIIDEMLCKLHKYHVENKPEVYKDIDYFFSKAEFEKILEEKNFFILSILDGVVVGLIWYRRAEKGNKFEKNSTQLWIDGLYVDERYRNKGIAKRLLSKVIDIAKNDGIDSVESMVWDFNEASKKLFAKYFEVHAHIMSYNVK
jgi:acetyltransferase